MWDNLIKTNAGQSAIYTRSAHHFDSNCHVIYALSPLLICHFIIYSRVVSVMCVVVSIYQIFHLSSFFLICHRRLLYQALKQLCLQFLFGYFSVCFYTHVFPTKGLVVFILTFNHTLLVKIQRMNNFM